MSYIPPTLTPARLREIASMMRRLTHPENGDANDLERWARLLDDPAPGEFPARLVVVDLETGRELWVRNIQLIATSPSSDSYRATQPIEPAEFKFAGTVDLFMDMEVGGVFKTWRVRFPAPNTAGHGEVSIKITWPEILLSRDVG